MYSSQIIQYKKHVLRATVQGFKPLSLEQFKRLSTRILVSIDVAAMFK